MAPGFLRSRWRIAATRFGEITTVAPQLPEQDQTFSPKVVTDVSLGYRFSRALAVQVGANNLFDVYPDKFKQNPRNNEQNFSADPTQSYNSGLDNTNRGRFVYNANQFGFQGAFYFARVNVTLP